MIKFIGGWKLPEVELQLPIRRIAADSTALIKLRVFQDGKRSDGREASPYSVKGPVYIPLSGVGSGTPLHKPKGGEKKPGTRKYDSYAAFRAGSGLTTKKTFTLSGRTAARFGPKRITKTGFVLGWPGGSVQNAIAHGHHQREDRKLFRLAPHELAAIAEMAKNNVVIRIKR